MPMSNGGRRGQRFCASAVALAVLAGCATPPQGPAGTQGTPSSSSSSAVPVGMTTTDVTKAPCDEAARKQAAWGNAVMGGLLGALAGALAGALIDKMLGNNSGGKGTKVGAVAGAALGAKVGYDRGVASANRQCEVWRAAQALATDQGFATLQIGKEAAGEILVTPDLGHFIAGTATLTPKGVAYYKSIAAQYTQEAQLRSYQQSVRTVAENAKKNERDQQRQKELEAAGNYTLGAEDTKRVVGEWLKLRIILTGHTHDQVNLADAQRISESRAETVAKLFKEAGVPEDMLLYQGAGAAFPVADNSTPEGREKNNRVEIVALVSEEAIVIYENGRTSDHRLFSPIAGSRVAGTQTPTTRSQETTATGASAERGQAVSRAPQAAASAATTRRPAPTTQPTKPASATAMAKASPQKQDTPVAKQSATQIAANSGSAARNTAAAVSSVTPVLTLDFGGNDLAGDSIPNIAAKLGRIQPPAISLASLFGLGSAYAERTPAQSCHLDDPLRHKVGAIKRLATGTARTPDGRPSIPASEAYLGIVGRSYAGMAGIHFIEIKGVTPKASGELADPISFRVYEGFSSKSADDKSAAKPDFTVAPTALAIRGEGGVMVRQFFNKEHGLECMDFLIPNRLGEKRSEDGALIYRRNDQRKVLRVELES